MCEQEIHSRFNEILTTRNSSRGKEILNDFEIFNITITYCLNSLDFEYRKILQLTFFKKEYPFWWIDTYSKSAFYRKRNKAMRSFVLVFETRYEIINDSSINVSNDIF